MSTRRLVAHRAGRECPGRRRAVVLRVRATPTASTQVAAVARLRRHGARLGHVGLAAGRLRGLRRRATPGSPAASPGSSGVAVVGLLMAGARPPPAAPRAADASAEVGSGPSAHLHVDGTTPLHRMPAARQARRPGRLRAARRLGAADSTARPRRAAARGRRRCCWSTRVPLRHLLPRLAVELPFVVFALLLPVRRRRPAGGRSGRSRCRRPASTPRSPCSSRARCGVRRGRRVRRHHPPARPRAGPAAPAGARHARHHRGLHGALRRRRRRPDAPDAGRPRLPRLHAPARCARGRRSPRAPAPSSSAATSAASGCTSPWSAAAGRAGCRSPSRSSPPRRQWALALAAGRGRRGGHAWGCGSDERARARPARRGLRLPRWPPGAVRRRPARAPGGAGGPARAQRSRQDDARAAPQRHPDAGRRRR